MGCAPCKNKQKRMEIVMVGPPGVGKTVIFFKLTDHPTFNNPVPTKGYNSEVIQYEGKNITIIDIGQRPQEQKVDLYRQLRFRGIIFVIDSSDRSRFKESWTMFDQIVRKMNMPILIYLTKKDKAVITESEVESQFQLRQLQQFWKVQSCNGLTGEGIGEGFYAFYKAILQKS